VSTSIEVKENIFFEVKENIFFEARARIYVHIEVKVNTCAETVNIPFWGKLNICVESANIFEANANIVWVSVSIAEATLVFSMARASASRYRRRKTLISELMDVAEQICCSGSLLYCLNHSERAHSLSAQPVLQQQRAGAT